LWAYAKPVFQSENSTMLDAIIRFSIAQRWLILFVTIGMAAFGIYSYQRLPIDAVPDITNVQVQINTEARGYSPVVVEQQITYPIELEMAGLPELDYIRSLSRYGLSQVTVVFEEGTDIYFARDQIAQRLQQIADAMPAGIEPQMGPISTGLGEILIYTVEAEPGARQEDGSSYSPMDLRVVQDWVIAPQLRQVPGVVEVNTIGGYERQFHITPDPAQLRAYDLSFEDVVASLERNNANVGAGYIERRGSQYLINVPGRVQTLDEIRNIILAQRDGFTIRIGDVAGVGFGQELRTGAATQNGQETVLGTAMMLIGENSLEVAERVEEKLADVNRSLPEGLVARPVYSRTTLVEKAIETVRKNLLEGALLVVVVLFAFLGNLRAALITACVIPLSMLFTITGMVRNEVSANLMSLGALDFGLIVDGAVIIVENCIRRLGEAQRDGSAVLKRNERFNIVFDATREVIRPASFGVFIITVVYLPIFALTGVEGKMFHPMAITVVMALIGALILAITFVPAAIAIFVGGRVGHKENILVRGTKRVYEPLLRASLTWRLPVVTAAAVLVVLSGLLATRMGAVFIPQLNEGDLSVQAIRVTGTGLEQSLAMQKRLERTIMQLPEVERVFARTGTAEVATDAMPPNVSDTYVIVKPHSQWPNPDKPRNTLINDLREAVENVPGNNYEFSQPIQLRTNELIAGVRADLAVEVYGDDFEQLVALAQQIESLVRDVPGATDVRMEQVTGLPLLSVEPDRQALYRYGLNVADVQETVRTALGGVEAGQVFEGDRRFPLVVRLPEDLRTDPAALERLLIPLPTGGDETGEFIQAAQAYGHSVDRMEYVPLSEVATIRQITGPNQISRENISRRVYVSANVEGRDLASVVNDIQARVRNQIDVPPGYWIDYGGSFENLLSATQRLQIVVPAALLIIFVLLMTAFGSARDAALVFTGVPMALTGGVAALYLRDIPLSISAGVGFIALSGVAVLNGLVMLSFIRERRKDGLALEPAIIDGALTRLRPVLMTALVASLGFVPMALNTGTGAEVQRPLATVVIGGIISSTSLTLLVLPALYRLAYRDKPLEAEDKLTFAEENKRG
jgi:heavy metal efflux system protein